MVQYMNLAAIPLIFINLPNKKKKPTTKKPGFLGEVFKNKQKNMLLEIKSTDI